MHILLAAAAWSAALAPACPRAGAVAMSSVVSPIGARMPARRQAAASRAQLTRVYVDGYNLMNQRGVTKGREALARKLGGIGSREVFLVFDGKPGEEQSETGSDPCVVVTEGGSEENGVGKVSADAWIFAQVAARDKGQAVEVVTADRFLRKDTQRADAKTINPVKWWRRYLPRLKGLKSDYTNAPREEA